MILLKQKREEKGLSQPELARLSGVSQQSISQIENGSNRNPGILTMIGLAIALECELRDLYKPEAEGGKGDGGAGADV